MKSLKLLGILIVMWTTISASMAHDHRPPPDKRLFNSTVIDTLIKNVASKMKDGKLAMLFVDALPNTLDTTVYYDDKSGDTFVITGDIDAMWLRDSSGQVATYVPYVNQDVLLKKMIKGVIKRQVNSVGFDAYANAFNKKPALSPHDNDVRHPPMTPELFEGKYELDSLAWVMHLSTLYFNYSKDDTICTNDWFIAMEQIVSIIKYQQLSSWDMKETDELFYSFSRMTNTQIDTLMNNIGVPGRNCGMSKSTFRPSDDAHQLPYVIASNAMASVMLKRLSEMTGNKSLCFNQAISDKAGSLSSELRKGITDYGIVTHRIYDKLYAYEVDGYGSQIIMDDPGLPSLMSLPLWGFIDKNDPIYQNTRKLILSNHNPYYFSGSEASGNGSPHTGPNFIWPMGLIVQALTSTDDSEILSLLSLLRDTTNNTYFIHESFNVSNPSDFTRPWFAWANSLFGELILTLARERPHLIF